ncbi:hypothetical protein COCCADRAFT_104123 [Bipolaris zeicola 26-R-13]|uniref:RRM domain-containing protein n=1 Tax=Cochliobolus carbonum (strain 26-R-13) TaxID=930089 RepID=W6XX61_COCC2|nr:uncharacterized protein COCCADRAFT_104123 [Bipolaris zeicola 26-R-13]EUC30343.1 hypothetical protein COCCADRAFT_104123 [Bipolaris zeicola 26-R-13]
MTLVAGTRVSNERLIFVKNVPSYVADDQVEELFSPYRPVSYKNIYKGSSITTIVVGFRTTSDAARAQRETDGKCLGSAIIRVEMYEQRRSIRYIRDHGYNSTPWDVEEDEGEEEYEEEPYEEVPPKEATAGFSPYYPAPVKLSSTAAQGTTWAHIASRQHTQGVTNAPAITKADSAPSPASTPIATPQIPTVIPVKPIEAEAQVTQPSSPVAAVSPSNNTTIAISEPAAHDEPSSDGAHEPESEHQVMRWSEILRWAEHSSGDGIQEMQSRPYVPIDTMVRIRQVHCRDCAFCKSMERVRNGRE